MRRLFGSLLVLLALTSVPQAQAPPPRTLPGGQSDFRAEDMLKVSTASVLDMTDDGQWVAVSVRRGFDNAETDNRRYGDPTYVSPLLVRVLIINTETGTTQSPFADLADVRQAAWSRDGQRLAILSLARMGAGDPAVATPRLQIWDVSRAQLTDVPRRGDARVAPNSGLEWSTDDRHLVVSLRSADRDRAARDRFKAITEGPVIVHNAKDPFLEWDDLGRANRWRSLAEIDVNSGEARTILPERKLSSYSVSRDGSTVTFLEDVTEKTDYEVIGGTDNVLRVVQASGGPVKTVAEAKDIKGVQLRWSDDGRTFAYAKKGEVFVQKIDEARATEPDAASRVTERLRETGRGAAEGCC